MPLATNPQTGETVFLADDGAWKPAQTAVNPQTKEMMAFDGKTWSAVEAKSKGVLGYIDDAVRSLASGATFGYADELAAKMDELTGRGGSYDQNLAREQARDAQIPAAIKYPGEIAGAVGSAVAAAPVTGAVGAASGFAKLPGIAKAILGGTGVGAAFGSGDAQPGQRLQGAAQGAAIGAATGAVLPPIVGGIGRAATAIKGAISPQANVAADLGRAISRDNTTPEALLAHANELNAIRPGVATLADAGGENVRGLVERIAQTPGAGRTTVIPALTGRQQGQLGRLSADLSELTGTRQSATQAIQETMSQRADAAKPLYEKAFNFNAREVPEIAREWESVSSTGWGRSIVMSPNFRRTLQTEYGIKDATDAPLMVVIDAFKKQADDLVSAALRNGNNNQARVIGDMRERLVSVLDEHNPAYKEARAAWAGPSRYMQAIEEGRNILNTKVGSEELRNGMGALSDVDREGFRIGAVSAIQAKMGSDPAKMADLTKYLRSPEVRAKIAAMMPNEEAAQKWAQRLNFEVSSSEMTGRALGNSATARRLAEQSDANGIAGDLVMDMFAGSPPVGLLRRAIGAVPQKIRDTLRSRSDEILAELLTDPQSMNGLKQAIDRVSAQGQPRSIMRSPANAAAINATNAGAADQFSGL